VGYLVVARNRSGDVNELAFIFLECLLRLELLCVGDLFRQNLVVVIDLKPGKRVVFHSN
jgi:hypothetical protein